MQFALSTQCYLGLKSIWFLWTETNHLIHLALEAGYDGVEYFPLRFRSTNLDNIELVYLQHILSGHQTWRSEVYLWDIWCTLAAFAFLAVPERRGSMDSMLKLQDALQNIGIEEIPITIYPHHVGKLGNKIWNEDQYPEFWDIDTRVVQTAPDLLRRWNIHTPQDFVKVAKSMGYAGLVVDTKHIRGLSEPDEDDNGCRRGFGDVKAALEVFLPHTNVLHVQPVSLAELYEMVVHKAGDLANILGVVKNQGWKDLVVVEVKSDYAAALLDSPPRVMSEEQFVLTYGKILNSVKELMM